MLICKIEPTGCCERKGLVQIRFCMYLEVGQTNPFHNHFIYVEPETTDDEIMDIGEAFLQEAFTKWSNNEKLDLKNPPIKYPEFVSEARRQAVAVKVKHLKATILERIL